FRNGEPLCGSILITVAPRSARRPPAIWPAKLRLSSTTTTSESAPRRSTPGSPNGCGRESAVICCPSREAEHPRGIPVEPLLLDGVLQRQPEVLLDQRLV